MRGAGASAVAGLSGRSRGAGRPPKGCVLGIETSWRVGSVALAIDGSVVARRFLTTPAAHASGLIPAIREVLEDGGACLGRLAGVVIGAGPGSFTGIRIGGAAAKALATSLGVPLYATSSLRAASCAEEALAAVSDLPPELRGESVPPGRGGGKRPATGGDGREHRYVLLDARRGRVYGAGYDVGADGAVQVTAPHGGTILDVINGRPSRGTVFMGEGALAHRALLHAAGYRTRSRPAGVPVADAVLSCCAWEPVDAACWEPRYVRPWRPG